MKRSNEVRLGLEVLEDRLAPNGAFGGAINAGAPSYPPLNAFTATKANSGQNQPAWENSFGLYTSVLAGQTQAAAVIQSQVLAFQATQIAMIDQVFSQWQAMIQALHLNTTVIV